MSWTFCSAWSFWTILGALTGSVTLFSVTNTEAPGPSSQVCEFYLTYSDQSRNRWWQNHLTGNWGTGPTGVLSADIQGIILFVSPKYLQSVLVNAQVYLSWRHWGTRDKNLWRVTLFPRIGNKSCLTENTNVMLLLELLPHSFTRMLKIVLSQSILLTLSFKLHFVF